MTWVRKKDTEEARKFWSHVETVAKSVRESEIYANHRVGHSSGLEWEKRFRDFAKEKEEDNYE